jgi:hypothetical protein
MARVMRPGPTTSRLLQQKSHFRGQAWLKTNVTVAWSRMRLAGTFREIT